MDAYPRTVGQPGAAQATQVQRVPFQFTGSTSEYFKIWLVNVALTVVTLGIYSAWAKVRTRQYFYRHTQVAGSCFEYLANPISILKGRLIIGVFLGAMAASQYLSMGVYALLAVLLALATPFLFVQSLKFNARNSALRNMRFSFTGNSGEAYGVFILAWLAPLVTCGIAYPYSVWRVTQFMLTRHLYGDERFDWSAKSSQYYRVFLVPLLAQLPLLLVMGAIVGYVTTSARRSGGEPEQEQVSLIVGVVLAVFYPVIFALTAYIKAKTTNLLFGHLSLGNHRFEANQRARDLIGLYFVNAVAVLVSLGLLVPWAKIRLARYKADHLQLLAHGPLVVGSNPMAQSASALGDAATDLGDIGFDFGF